MKVSIIIPVYNTFSYLDDCAKSVLEQTFTDFEVIMIDDGSTDGSGQLCDRLALQDDRIRVIHQANGGLSAARNTGLSVARGEYVTFLDSDDMISHHFLETMMQAITQEKVQVAICNWVRFERTPAIEALSTEEAVVISGRDAALRQYDQNGVLYVVAWGKVYPRKWFDGLEFPVGRIHEDEALTYKLLYRAKRVAVLDQKLYYYRIVPDSIMNRSFSAKRYDGVTALDEREKYYIDKKDHALANETLKEKERLICKLFLQAKFAGKIETVPKHYLRRGNYALRIIKGNVSKELYEWYFSIVHPKRARARFFVKAVMKKIGRILK